MMLTLPHIHLNARQRAAKYPLTLLVWHDLVRQTRQVWFDTTLAEWEEQLNRLAHAGAKPISLQTLYSYLKAGTPIPPPGACLFCFDDNTVGIYDIAVPSLKRRNWPFVISAHTAYIGKKTGKAHNTYDMLRDMEALGGTLVSQTHTHPADLRTLSESALKKEFSESQRQMAENLGHPVHYVTYPSGKWDQRVAEAAMSAGYLLGLTEDYGAAESSPHLLGIHRYSTHRRFEEALRSIARSSGRRI